jgi:hypothetical protein
LTDDGVIDIRQHFAKTVDAPVPRVFSVWGGEGAHSRFALPVWRAVALQGGDWGGIVSLSKIDVSATPQPLFALDLLREPARIESPLEPLRALGDGDVPSLAVTSGGGTAVLLGEDGERWWFLRALGGGSDALPEGKARETLLFLAGECAGLLFLRELATPLPSSSSAP